MVRHFIKESERRYRDMVTDAMSGIDRFCRDVTLFSFTGTDPGLHGICADAVFGFEVS